MFNAKRQKPQTLLAFSGIKLKNASQTKLRIIYIYISSIKLKRAVNTIEPFQPSWLLASINAITTPHFDRWIQRFVDKHVLT